MIEIGPDRLRSGATGHIELESGKSYLFLLEQFGANAKLTIVDPAGLAVPAADMPQHVRGFESVVVQPGKSGSYQFQVEPLMPTNSGKAILSVLNLPTNTEDDEQRILAESLISNNLAHSDMDDPTGLAAVIEQVERSRVIFADLELRERQAWATYLQAWLTYWHLGDWDQSASLAQEAHQIYLALDMPSLRSTALALEGMALLEAKEGDSKELTREKRIRAQEIFRVAIEIQTRADAMVDVAWIANSSGIAYFYEREIDQSIARYELAVDKALLTGAEEYFLLASRNLAVAYDHAGKISEAILSMEQLVQRIASSSLSHEILLGTYFELGRNYLRIGRWDKAIAVLTHGLDGRLNASDKLRITVRLAYAYLKTANVPRARVYLQQALELSDEAKEVEATILLRDLQASVIAADGDVERAITLLESAAEDSPNDADQGYFLINLARLQGQMGKLEASANNAKKAVDLLDNSDLKLRLAEALVVAARTHVRTGEINHAWIIDSLEQASTIAKGHNLPALDVELLLANSEYQNAIGHSDLAMGFATEAIDELWQQRFKVQSAEFRLGFFDENDEVVRHYLLLGLDQYKKLLARTPDEALRLSKSVFATVENLRASSLRDKLLARYHASQDGSHQIELSELRNKLSELSFRLSQMTSEQHVMEAQIRAEFESTLRNYELTEWRSASKSPITMRSMPFEALQASIGIDKTIIEYWLGNPVSVAWIISHDSFETVLLASEEEIQQTLDVVLKTISIAGSQNNNTADLRRLILDPVADYLKTERVSIVADGVLQLVPFSALFSDSQAQSTSPITVSFVPSVNILSLQDPLAKPVHEPPSIAIFADPVFSQLNPNDKPTAERPESLRGLQLVALPGTRKEAESIAEIFPGEVSLNLGRRASRKNLLELDFDRYQYLHIATHGLINSQYPAQSAIALSNSYVQDLPVDDGFLTMSDVGKLRLSTNLVVLSGCSTALGRFVHKEGALGFASAFLAAGSKSILVSLWDVPDEATAALMIAFYKAHLDRGLDLAAALALAQEEIRSNPQWNNYRFWAGWVLIET